LATDAPLTALEGVLLQDCLALHLKLALGRHLIGASDAEVLRSEVVAWLATADLPASRLAQRLSPRFRAAKATQSLDAALAAVAQPVGAAGTLGEERVYRLRDDCQQEVEPYFWGYKPGDLQRVEEHHRQVRRVV